jgi:hypothetical protein
MARRIGDHPRGKSAGGRRDEFWMFERNRVVQHENGLYVWSARQPFEQAVNRQSDLTDVQIDCAFRRCGRGAGADRNADLPR